MTLQLPGGKLRKIPKCQLLLDQETISVRELSKFLGLLTSSIQAIFPAPIHYRHLRRLNNTTLSSHSSYEATVVLNALAKEEILWWRDHLHAWNGQALFQDQVDLIIETDASRKGWGAYCQGVRTGGPLVSHRKETPHQLSRALGRFSGNQNIHQIPGMCTRKIADGQCISSGLHKQDGRHPFPSTGKFSNRSVGVVLPESFSSVGSTSPLVLECEGGSGIQDNSGL